VPAEEQIAILAGTKPAYPARGARGANGVSGRKVVSAPAAQPLAPLRANWRELIEQSVGGLGYELVDADRSARGLLRVFIDRVPGRAYPTGESESVTVDDCEAVTRQLQYALEVDAVAYERLEVSSPGLDRPLRHGADYERFAGSPVELALKAPFQGRKHWKGRLERAPEGEGWTLALEGDQVLSFTLDEVREARLVPVLDFKGKRNRQSAPADKG
jgi:ribosome maturation factor RimP